MILLLLIAFLLELVAFFSFAALALLIEMNTVLQAVVYVALLIIVTVFWGVFMSPKAPKKLPKAKYYLAKGAIYAVAAFVLISMVNVLAGAVFVIVWLADDLLLFGRQRTTK